MKKFVYLCGMILLSMNMMAQIDLNDKNWDTLFIEDFTTSGRTWDTLSFLSSDDLWRAYPGDGVSSNSEHHVYQFSNSHFNDADGQMELVAEYAKNQIDNNDYYLPLWMLPSYGGSGYPSSTNLYYFSGEIDYINYNHQTQQSERFRFGYFEIRCKLPEEQGAHPAFWLHGADTNPSDSYYEEIDILEYSWALGDPIAAGWLSVPNPKPTQPGDPWVYSTAIVHNLHGQYVDFDTDVYGQGYPRINYGQSITGWHTYSCEWMPDHIYWYLDGELVNSYFDKDHIPNHPLTLKTNYAIDGYYNHGGTTWMGTDKMDIDYIRVYQLKWDCDTDEVIICQDELNTFIHNPSVKNSVTITPVNGSVSIGNTGIVTFRVAGSFEITGPFEASSGCEFTVIRQDCPE